MAGTGAPKGNQHARKEHVGFQTALNFRGEELDDFREVYTRTFGLPAEGKEFARWVAAYCKWAGREAIKKDLQDPL